MKDGAPVDTVPGSSTSTSVSDLPRDGVATLSVVPMGPAARRARPRPRSLWASRRALGGAGPTSQFAVLKNGQQIATVPATGADTNTFTATGLQPNAPAAFSVVPLSPSGAPSGPASPQVPVTPYAGAGGAGFGPGASSPSAPSNLQLTSVSPSGGSSASGTLSWSPPATGAPQSYQIVKDGVSVGTVPGSKTSATVSDLPRGGVANLSVGGAGAPASYSVLQNGQPVATVPATGETNSFVATGLQPGVPAVFSVVPVTPASGLGGAGSPGAGALSAPSNVQLTNVSTGLLGGTSGTLSWNHPATGAPQSYQIMKDGAPSTPVVPMGPGGAPGTASAPLSVGVPSSPGAGITLTATPASASSARLAWNRPQGGAGPTSQFAVLKNGQQIATVPATGADTNTFTATGLQPNAPAAFSVVPLSPSGAPSGPASPQVPVTPSSGASFAGAAPSPQAPSGLCLTATHASPSSGTLSWKHPAAGPAASYTVMQNGRVVGAVPRSQTSFNIPARPPQSAASAGGAGDGSASSFVVVPMSAGGAAGTPSFPLLVSSSPGSSLPRSGAFSMAATPIAPDASAAELTWDAPAKTQQADISGYAVLVNGQQAAVVPPSASGKNSYTATGLPPGAVLEVMPVRSKSAGPGPQRAPSSASLALPLLSTGRGAPARSGSAPAATTAARAPGAPGPGAPADLELADVESPPFGTTTGTLTWKHPATGAPATYAVLQGGLPIATVPGTQTSFKCQNLPSGKAVQLSVVPMSASGTPGPASHSLNAVCILCMIAAMLQS
eukprot:tig00000940_g5549.t1